MNRTKLTDQKFGIRNWFLVRKCGWQLLNLINRNYFVELKHMTDAN